MCSANPNDDGVSLQVKRKLELEDGFKTPSSCKRRRSLADGSPRGTCINTVWYNTVLDIDA